MPPTDTSGPTSPNDSATSWGAPFQLPAGEPTCFLIHGFTAAPQEMRFLGDQLHAKGLTVCGARVAGHGTTVDDFERSTWNDWIDSIHQQFKSARQSARKMVVVGQSMGSLLALSLAMKFPDQISALVLLAPALVLQQRWLSSVRPLLPMLAHIPSQRFQAKGRSDIADPSQHEPRETYDRIPLRAVYQFLCLQREIGRLVERTPPAQPTLIVYSKQDHTCSPEGVERLQQHLRGPLEVVAVENSYHVVSVDFDRQFVADTIHQFVDRSTASS